MMKIKQKVLLSELKGKTEQILEIAKGWQSLPTKTLNYQSEPNSWSALECLAHLNLYGDFYLLICEEKILKAHHVRDENLTFKSGWLGNYSANLMLPQSGEIKKMQTFKDKNPAFSDLPESTLEKFIRQQERMLELLDLAKNVDMTKVKTPITLTKWIQFRLGDTFRFVINHNMRHILQAQKAIDNA